MDTKRHPYKRCPLRTTFYTKTNMYAFYPLTLKKACSYGLVNPIPLSIPMGSRLENNYIKKASPSQDTSTTRTAFFVHPTSLPTLSTTPVSTLNVSVYTEAHLSPTRLYGFVFIQNKPMCTLVRFVPDIHPQSISTIQTTYIRSSKNCSSPEKHYESIFKYYEKTKTDRLHLITNPCTICTPPERSRFPRKTVWTTRGIHIPSREIARFSSLFPISPPSIFVRHVHKNSTLFTFFNIYTVLFSNNACIFF